MNQPEKILDNESVGLMHLLEDEQKIRMNRVPGVRTVLVVLSSRGMAFDRDSIRQKIILTYPEAVIFFKNTRGDDLGAKAPSQVDLLIDLTGPRQKQCLFYARKLRKTARVATGRNVGFFRKNIYDKVFDEKAHMKELPLDLLERERMVQKQVLALAGVALAQTGNATADLSKKIALDLPPMGRL